MTRKEYLRHLTNVKIDAKKVDEVASAYGTELPEVICKIVSDAKETIFFDDEYRILSLDEIVEAENDLHVEFKEKGILPLVDCGENDFIVFHFNDGFWSTFNINDETVFRKRDCFEELME